MGLIAGVLALGPSVIVVACGARTPLLAPDTAEVGLDATDRRDVRIDVPREAIAPPLDATQFDAFKDDCADSGATLVYLVTSQTELLSFHPPSATFKKIGNIACPAASDSTPYSMGVDRTGVAYVVYRGLVNGFGGLFRVSTANASCTATSFKAPSDMPIFGMAYSTRGPGPMEDLFLIGNDGMLATADLQNNAPVKIAIAKPDVLMAELTGTGDGRLYAFFRDQFASGTFIAELDKSNAKVVGGDPIPLEMGMGWAFAYWGGDFWIFTNTIGNSQVHRYRPSDKSLALITTYNGNIVGAGVSTCAPM